MKKIFLTTVILGLVVITHKLYSEFKIGQKVEKGLLVQKPFGVPIQKEPSAIPNEWFGMQRTWPHGKFDEQFYIRMLDEVYQKRNDANSNIFRNEWQSIGPTNIGGRITDIAIHPDEHEVLYIGSASGGIYKSENNGQSWQHLFQNSPVISIGDLAIDPNNSDILFAGTGEANSSSFSFPGNGIYKSNDGGQSWHQTGLTESAYFGRIIVDYSNSNRVFAAACGSLFTPGPYRGIYRSDNGGENWEQVLFVTDSTSAIDLVQHPINPDILYASMWERIRGLNYRRSGGLSSGIYKTIDGGENWTELENGLPQDEYVGRIGIDISVSNPNVLYAFYDKQMEEDEENSFSGIYKSVNGGNNWARTNDENLTAMNRSFGWYFGQIRIDPTDEDVVYALGVELVKTTNGGDSWEIIAGYYNSDIIHVDHHAFQFLPNQNTFWIGNDGGLYNSQNGGETWTHFNNIPLTQFYKMEINPSDPDHVVGGTQDNGTIQTNNEIHNWNRILGGDGFYVEIHPENPNIIFAEYQWGQVRKSVNGGDSWEGIGSEFRDDRTNWSTPILMDHFNPDIIYVGTHRIWKSVNSGNTFYDISIDLTMGDDGSSYHTVTALTQSTINQNYLLVGTDDGRLHFSEEEGIWAEISAGLPSRWITSVAFDPIEENTIYCTVSGFRWDVGEAHIFKSENLGQSWNAINGDLPEMPVNCMIVDPINNLNILVGTDAGVFGTNDGGDTWIVFGNGLPAVPITDLQLHENTRTLVAGTYGCSAFSLIWDSFISGDVTMDGLVNVTDIILLINFILNEDIPTDSEFEIADINMDENLNVLDVIGIVNIILGN